MPADGLETGCLSYISRLVAKPELIQKTVNSFAANASSELATVEGQLSAVKANHDEAAKRLGTLLDLISDTPKHLADAIREQATDLAGKRHELSLQLTALAERARMLRSEHPDAEQVKSAFTNFTRLVRSLPMEDQKKLMRLVCERIRVGRPISKAYMEAVRAGQTPRTYRVQLFLNTTSMNDLDLVRTDLIPNMRPKANIELAFTLHIPANGKTIHLIEGNETVEMPAAREADDAQEELNVVNVVARARDWDRKLKARSGSSAAKFAKEEGVSPATLSLHFMVLRKMSPGIVDFLHRCNDNNTHRWFSLRTLIGLAKLPEDRQQDAFKQGLDEASKAGGPGRN